MASTSTSSQVGFLLLLCLSFCSASRLLINPANAENPSSARSLTALQSNAPAGDGATLSTPTLPSSSDSKWSSGTKSGHFAAGGCGGCGGYWGGNWCGCGGGGSGGSYSGSCCGPPPPSCCQPVTNCYPVTCPPVSNCCPAPPPPPPPPTCCSSPCQPPSGCCNGCPPVYGSPGSAAVQSHAETQSLEPDQSDAKKHDAKGVEISLSDSTQESEIESDGKMRKEEETENETIN